MNKGVSWDHWSVRLAVLWADSVQGLQLAVSKEEDDLPVLQADGIRLVLAPSYWGFGTRENDVANIEKAFETIIQGRAPDYWRETQDPLVQALGWLDRRIGKRSWRHRDDEHGSAGRNPLEQQVRALRDHADAKLATASSARITGRPS